MWQPLLLSSVNDDPQQPGEERRVGAMHLDRDALEQAMTVDGVAPPADSVELLVSAVDALVNAYVEWHPRVAAFSKEAEFLAWVEQNPFQSEMLTVPQIQTWIAKIRHSGSADDRRRLWRWLSGDRRKSRTSATAVKVIMTRRVQDVRKAARQLQLAGNNDSIDAIQDNPAMKRVGRDLTRAGVGTDDLRDLDLNDRDAVANMAAKSLSHRFTDLSQSTKVRFYRERTPR